MKAKGTLGCVFSILICSAQLCFADAIPGDEHWDYHFDYPGVSNLVLGVEAIEGKIYAAGISTFGTSTNSLDVWDGTNWTSIGTASYAAYDYCKIGSNLYVGGLFGRINGNTNVGLARWDGNQWHDVGGFKGTVLCLATDGTNLYVGGSITNAGGVAVANIAMWDGSAWSGIGSGLTPADGANTYYVTSLLVTNGQIYVAGTFTGAGGSSARGIAQWNGSTWSAVGGSLNNDGYGLAMDSGNLYVVGAFTSVAGVPANHIARWDGNNWSALGSGLNTNAVTVAVLNGNVYAGGSFTNAGGIAATRIAKWDGFSWSALGAGMSDIVEKIVVSGTNLCIGGYFSSADNLLVNHVCLYDGTNFSRIGVPRLDQGAGLFTRSVAVATNGDLYVGGVNLTGAGDARLKCIGRFDGTKWFDVGGGVKGTNTGSSTAVNALAISGNIVYAGGLFTNAGGISANNVAKWDGTNWSALGSGVTGGTVFAIAVDGNNVYVGGSFTAAGGNPVYGIARWDGNLQAWFPIPGAYASAQASTQFNTILPDGNGGIYAGGIFTVGTTTGGYCTNIAANAGNGWIALGTGANNNVNGLALWGSNLYAAGKFTSISGVTANRIAKWDGSTWSALGSGISGSSTSATVSSLAVANNLLIAAGSNFTNAGGNLVNVIAAWDGSKWSNLGRGLRRVASSALGSIGSGALAVNGNDLYVAGTFDTAGSSPSQNIARWNPTKVLSPLSFRMANLSQNGSTVQFRLSGTGDQFYDVQRSVDLVNWTTVLRTNIPEFDYSEPAVQGARFFRAWFER